MLGRTGDPSAWLLPTSPRTLLTHPPSNSFLPRAHSASSCSTREGDDDSNPRIGVLMGRNDETVDHPLAARGGSLRHVHLDSVESDWPVPANRCGRGPRSCS